MNNIWSLHCAKCSARIAFNDILILGTIPPSQYHLSVKPGSETTVYQTLRKVERLEDNVNNCMFSLYKLLCQNCDAKVGGVELIEGHELMCFKVEDVVIRDSHGLETKERRLKKLLPVLKRYGIEEFNLSPSSKFAKRCDRPKQEPVVYCDTSELERTEVNTLTLDNPRDYQIELFKYAMYENSLVFLPTGSGKTLVAAMAVSCMKMLNPGKLAVFIVDRIPLAYQQGDYIKRQIPSLRVEILAGHDVVNQPSSKSSFEETLHRLAEQTIDVLVSTHQIFLNILADPNGAFGMEDVCILVMDEAHHCQGNHPFNQILRDHYMMTHNKYKPLVLALSASPAGEPTLDATLTNLTDLLKRLCSSPCMPVVSQDLPMYTNKPQTIYKVIPLTPLQESLKSEIEKYLQSIGPLLAQHGNIKESPNISPLSPNYRGFLRKIIGVCHDVRDMQGHALGEMAMHLVGVLELNNVLGIQLAVESLQECFELIENASTPMERQKKIIVDSDYNFRYLKIKIESIKAAMPYHSHEQEKFGNLVEDLEEFARQSQSDGTSRGIVFVKMRKTAHKFRELLMKYQAIRTHLNPMAFVGHGEGSDGMEWHDEQRVVLKHFRNGRTKLLVSTSVLEEGLDVPICNLIVRFDTSASLRSHLQSRGRASRRPGSKFILLCSDSTKKDEAATVMVKERNMEQAMRLLHNISSVSASQATKFACIARKPRLGADKQPSNNELRVNYPKVKAPSIKVAVHRSKDDDLISLIDFFNTNYEVKAMEPIEAKRSDWNDIEGDANSPSQQRAALSFELKYDHSRISKQRFLEDVTTTWCARENDINPSQSKAWLESLESANRRANIEVDVLVAESFYVGYFRHYNKFCQHWPSPQEPAELQSIRLLFQHDLKALMIFFTVREDDETNLYEIEIRYSELESFIFVDAKEDHANLFLSLKHAPKLHKSSKGANWNYVLYMEDVNLNDLDEEGSSVDEGYQVNREIDFEIDDAADEGDIEGVAGYADDDSGVCDDDDIQIIHTNEGGDSEFSHPLLSALDEIKKWSRASSAANSGEAFGQCLSYMLRVSYTDLEHVLSGLKNFGKDVFFAKVDTEPRALQSPTEVHIPPSLHHDVKYAIQCLFSYYPIVLGRISFRFSLLLTSKPKGFVLAAVEKLKRILDQDFFCQPEQTLERILQIPKLRPSRAVWQVPGHCALVKRAVLTPTRVLFGPEEIMQNNRVLRKYNPADFMCVNIRDEEFSKISSLSSDLGKVLSHIKDVIDRGINVCGELYSFLGCSNSQLRNHSFWFVKFSSNPQDIRKWMGDFSSIRCVGTYVSRLGQCFSTSQDTVGITIDQGAEWFDKEDVVTEDEKYTFSDGVGGISKTLADEVVKKLGKKFKPSAFQIRFAGCKGVLAVDSTLHGKQAYFRPSMRKFESSHRRLEVVQTSRPQAVFLNQQVIMLLSNLGVREEVFMKLMRNALDNLAGTLLDERLAIQQMSSVVKTGIEYRKLSDAGVALSVEPFFRSVIAAVYYDRLSSLLTKARIKLPVDKARLMMGVMDETGLLQYGQVFVQYSVVSTDPKTNDEFNLSKTHIHTGPVMVTRNPCLHPGDVRELVAVDTPLLRHLVDCVVFPKVGSRPHPSEMAGGDLDGDLYFVSWHKDFFPHPEKELFEPMNYEAPPKMQIQSEITPALMTQFIIDYIRSDQLGVIDNMHKAVADRDAQGVESETCLLLAEAHSVAVDAPKTGLWPKVPWDKAVKQYPDFMMKSDKPSYKSNKLLGKLYRACRAFKRNAERSLPTDVQRPLVDRAFVVTGYEGYVEEATALYSEYCENLEKIMSTYGIATEAELVSGCFRKLYKRLSRERTEVAEVVGMIVGDVRKRFRARFFEEFHMDDSRHKPESLVVQMIHRKAYAWYHVAYAGEPRPPQAAKVARFLSFPWVVDDALASIRRSVRRVQRDYASLQGGIQGDGGIHGDVWREISLSLTQRLADDRDMLLLEYKRRMSGKNLVSARIRQSNPQLQVAVFGSTATMLFRESSDVDLCVYRAARGRTVHALSKKEQLKLLKSLRPSMCKMFKNTRLVDRARVPVILCNKFKNDQVPSWSCNVPFDVSASIDGLNKAIVVSYYIMSDPQLLPVLRFLLLWGHVSGLTGHGKRRGVNTNALVFLFLSYCVSQGYVDELSEDVVRHFHERNAARKSVDQLQEWENILDRLVGSKDLNTAPPCLRDISLGEVLITFFARHTVLAELEIPKSIARLVNAKNVANLLNNSSITLLQEQMQRAYHVIALNRNLATLLDLSAAETREAIHLSTGLSSAMRGAELDNAREIQQRTGAKISIRPKVSSCAYQLIVEARGTELQVDAVAQLLQEMTRTSGALRAAFMSLCFVKGASLMSFEGSRDENDAVTLVPYHSHHHPQHDGTRLYTPMLATPIRYSRETPLSPTSHEFTSFKTKFLTQFSLASRDHEESLHGTMVFSVRFGRIYIFRVPKSFTEDAESVTIEKLQGNLKRGYQTKSAKGRKSNLVVTNSGVTSRSKRSRKKPQKKAEKKKPNKPKEKPCRSSYFTSISSQDRAETFLQNQDFFEEDLKEDYDVNVKGTEELSVRFDESFNFKELCFSPLRWCSTDVKRRWKERGGTQDGVESDIRFLLRSRRSLSAEEIRGTEFEVYEDMMESPGEPVLHPLSLLTKKRKQMFAFKEDLWNQVSMVRQKKTRRFRSFFPNELTKSLVVELIEVTEYSRPTTECSTFRKVFTRYELNLEMAAPSLSTDERDLSEFLKNIWQFAFQFSTFLSG